MDPDAFLAEIRMFAGNFAPQGWMFCDGSLLQISQYDALYSLIGTTFGGDGQMTFALPDLRGRVAIGPGQGPGLSLRSPGEMAGTETNTITTDQLPAHSHPAQATVAPVASNSGSTNIPVNNYPAVAATAIYGTAKDLSMGSNNVTLSVTASTSTGQPVNNIQPFQVTNYVICVEGIYPSRP